MNLRKGITTSLLFASLLSQPILATSHVKPIRGTWLNLTYQDVRNKYMNPAHIDDTNPELWRLKIKELSEMGVSYLVILAVANDQKSFYPSDLCLLHTLQTVKVR